MEGVFIKWQINLKHFLIITVLFVGLLIFNNFSGINSSTLLISILVVYVILLFIRYSINKKYKENQK